MTECMRTDSGVILRGTGSARDEWVARGAMPWTNLGVMGWWDETEDLIDVNVLHADVLGPGNHTVSLWRGGQGDGSLDRGHG